jgi:hypothetical protein
MMVGLSLYGLRAPVGMITSYCEQYCGRLPDLGPIERRRSWRGQGQQNVDVYIAR